MQPIIPNGKNFTYTAPPGTEGQCQDLHVRRAQSPMFGNSSTSLWRPHLEELKKLNEGAGVALTIFSAEHPVVSVGVEDAFGIPALQERITPEDAKCPILAVAPGEYTHWEKRVWRRGVCDAEVSKVVHNAVRESIEGNLFQDPPLGPVTGWCQDWVTTQPEEDLQRYTTFDTSELYAKERIAPVGYVRDGDPYPVGRLR